MISPHAFNSVSESFDRAIQDRERASSKAYAIRYPKTDDIYQICHRIQVAGIEALVPTWRCEDDFWKKAESLFSGSYSLIPSPYIEERPYLEAIKDVLFDITHRATLRELLVLVSSNKAVRKLLRDRYRILATGKDNQFNRYGGQYASISFLHGRFLLQKHYTEEARLGPKDFFLMRS